MVNKYDTALTKLKLQRPLVVFDLETTGINVVQARIIEIGYVKMMPDGTQYSGNLRVNPGIPIPPETTAIHGITDADVANCPKLKEISEELVDIFLGADLAGFNSDYFDVPLFVEECLRNEIPIDFSSVKCIDVQNIFHKMEPRTLAAALKFYCDETHENAHNAEADSIATLKVLQAQLVRYAEQVMPTVEALSAFSARHRYVDFAGRMVYNEQGEEVFNFGKYRGQRVVDVLKKDLGYYSWVMQGEFTLNTKQMLTKIRLRTLTEA